MLHPFEFEDGCLIEHGTIDASLIPSSRVFDTLWGLHPLEYSKLKIHGKLIPMPRWDQAFGRDYPFAKQVAVAKPTPDLLRPYLEWAQRRIDPRLNGLFVNWHDGAKGHYHGKHRDSVIGVIDDTPIVTVSLGEERIFRMRPYRHAGNKHDFLLKSGDFISIPLETNNKWTHEVPKFSRYKQRRISVTIRAFT